MKKEGIKFLLFSAAILQLTSCFTEKEVRPDKIRNNKGIQELVLQGWNTWSNPDLLNHVLMPEGLSVRLLFRTTNQSGKNYYMDQVMIRQASQTNSLRITPLAHNDDATYTHIKLEWEGLSANIQTTLSGEDLLILYTPEQWPENSPILILKTGILWNMPGVVEKKSNFIQAEFGTRAYSIAATEDDLKTPLPLTSPYLSFNSDKEIGFYTGKSRSLEQIKKAIAKSEEKYYSENEKYGRLAEAYNAMQNLLSWNQIFDAFNKRLITPSSRYLIESSGGFAFQNGDAYYSAIMHALTNKWNAYSNAIAITGSITTEGFIPAYTGALNYTGTLDRSQPPVGSSICLMIYHKYKERWFLKEVYNNLLTWNRWWPKARDNRGFLSWGSHSQPENEISNTRMAALDESGMGHSPLFDDAVFNTQTHKLELASVDLLSLYIADCKSLAEIAEILGNSADQKELLDRAENYSLKLGELWDEESGIYRDKNLLSNQLSPNMGPGNFYPLIARVPSEAQAKRMVNEHLLNPDEFNSEYMISGIAGNNAIYGIVNNLQQGRISPKMNFLVYLGLRNYDLPEARKILASKSAGLLLKSWISEKRVYESYNSLSGEGSDIDTNHPFYTGGGLLSLIALMEEGHW